MRIEQKRLKELLIFNLETGDFFWRNSRSKMKAGQKAGSITKAGYIKIRIDGKFYVAHRLAWLYTYGVMPTYSIDHIDLDKTNNRISNLRDVTKSVNQQNRIKARKDNKTGMLGVYFSKKYGSFCSQITISGKKKHIGSFKTAEDAHFAYIEAKRRLHEGCTI